MKNDYVSIVILNWNGNKYLSDCIGSIKKQTYSKIDLIIVDNFSTDGSLEYIRNNDVECVLLENQVNYGFSKGMNIGIEATNGEFILLLNNDVYLKEDFVEKCVEKLRSATEFDSVQGCAYHWENGVRTNDVQAGALFLKRRMQGCWLNFSKSVESFGSNGSFMFLRKSALDNVIAKSGYAFDEDFETGWEDMDFWFRLQLFGHRCIYIPNAIAWHVGSASAGEQKRLIDKDLKYRQRIFRNRLYVIYKNYTERMNRHMGIWLWLANVLMFPYYLIVSPSSLKARRLAKKEFKLNLDKMKIKRFLIQENVIVDYEVMKNFFVKF